MPRILLGFVLLAVTIYAVIDAIQTEGPKVKHLPKVAWILLILIFAPIGGIAWLVAGRQRGPETGNRRPHPPSAPRGPDDDPDFLRDL